MHFIHHNRSIIKEPFAFSEIDLDTLKKHAKRLSNTSSVGVDDIPTSIIKKFGYLILPGVLHIINLSIKKCQYPALWKLGIISPIPKKGKLELPKNWRPIVLNTILSKLLERVLNEQLTTFMRTSLQDPISQHAYRTGKSCGSAWTELDTFIQKNRNDGKVVGLVLTDQSAAFNVLEADILVPKLKLLGFHDTACRLIRDYLTGRKTKCVVNGHLSDTVDLTSGVGEGSVLGPQLYTLGQICASMVVKIVEERMKEEKEIDVNTLSCEYADDVTGGLATDTDRCQHADVRVQEVLLCSWSLS